MFVEVNVPLPVDETFTYATEELDIVLGQAVVVPFGSRSTVGYVTGFQTETPVGFEVKQVSRILDPTPAFNETQLRFFRWIADYYLAPLGEVIATALPSAYRARSKVVFTATEQGIEGLAQQSIERDDHLIVLREAIAKPGRTRKGLVRGLHQELDEPVVSQALDWLVRHGLVHSEMVEVKAPGAKVQTVQATEQAAIDVGGAVMRAALVHLLEASAPIDVDELVQLCGSGVRSALKRLEKRGLVVFSEREDRHPLTDPSVLPDHSQPPVLNEDQRKAVAGVAVPETHLLFGVTGSGKTEVYLQAARNTIDHGQQVLVLVPEIALTPQLTGRFRARFGDAVAVLHSGLTGTERLREWRRIRAGEAQVAVGARSALFAPFRQLGLVVVDEEHDDSYKQDDGVRYNARDLAVVLGRMAKAPVVLGSATPSMESWQNAQDGRYNLIPLPHRATPRPVPHIELIDLRGRPTKDPIAGEILEAIGKAVEDAGQAIVLYNRRGYATTVECLGCGAHYDCPSCGISLVYHQKRERLDCHYCGFHRRFTPDCPACGSEFAVLGHGTERIEETLRKSFPEVGIARMDADTTAGRGGHRRILERFRSGEVSILVGTQLVAKGHDFPAVTLAAVVGVDHILGLPDFRSAERTHALVTQLAGRAGRGDRPGRVLVQTRHPEHFVFRQLGAASQDLELDTFHEEEAHSRKILSYPPFSRLVLVRVEGADRPQTIATAQQLAQALRDASRQHRGRIDVLGPTSAPLGRLVGRWRFQVVLRGRDVPAFRKWLGTVRGTIRKAAGKGVRVHIDVDPRNLM